VAGYCVKFAFIIFKYFPYGGAQRDMLRIARACLSRGHKVKIYTGQWHGELPEQEIEVACLPFSGFLNHQRHLNLINVITRQIEVDRPDLVVGFNRMPGLDAYYAADPCFIDRAHTERSWIYRWTGRYRFFAAAENAVMRADGQCQIFLLSPREKDIFQRWYHTPDEKFHLLPPSIPSGAFSGVNRATARARLLKEFNLPEHANIILMVGSAFVRKGLDRAIRGLAALPENIRCNTWVLAIGEDNPEPMRQLAARLEVAGHVIVTPGRDDVPQLMAAADLLVHAARSELAGIVLIEAMTAGLPVLVTDVCGYAAHIENARAGVVLPSPFDQTGLDRVLAEMLESPQREQWRTGGLQYTADIAAKFSPTTEAELLETFAQEKKR
jgi:UDP-glucose:(heptosyl)LPS alpha-1,3-glucosyltransferase